MTSVLAPDLAIAEPPSRALAAAQDGLAVVAESYLQVFHDRHLPLPPDYSLALARMESADKPAEVAPLGVAWDHAATALSTPQSLGRQEVWAEFVPDFALHAIGPVLQEAVQRSDTLPLLGTTATRRAAPWDKVATPLMAELRRLLDTPEEMGLAFWSCVGVRLLGVLNEQKLGRIGRSVGATRLPFRPNARTCALVFQVEPDFGSEDSLPKPPEQLSRKAQRNRAALRPREGGVEGIITSRRIEDLPSALMSNFIAPEELRLIRLLEDGFTLTHRPPLRTPTRDLLALGLNELPPGHLAAEVAKAAWLDAALRLRFFLVQMDKAASDLAWCDERIPRASAMTASDLTDRAKIDPFKLSGEARIGLVTRSLAFPGFFAALPRAVPQPPNRAGHLQDTAKPRSAPDPIELACTAVAEALQDPRRHRRRGAARDAERSHVKATDYQQRFVVRVTPGMQGDGVLQPNWATDGPAYLEGLGITPATPTSLLAFYVPNTLYPGGPGIRVFSDFADDSAEVTLDTDVPEEEALAQMVGQLSLAVIAATLESLNA